MFFQSVEEFIYDIHGHVTDYTIQVTAFGNDKYSIQYQYDHLWNVVKTQYPIGDMNTFNSYDNGGRMYAIGTEEQPGCHAELDHLSVI